MMYEDIEKIIKELQEEYNKNVEIIKLSAERTRMAHFNQTEPKLGLILHNSVIPYLGLFLMTIIATSIIGPEAVANIINPLSIPAILTTSSLGIGTIINVIGEKQNNVKERIKNFSKAKTEVQRIEEEIYYAIELEKTKNRNEAIKNSMDRLKYYRTISKNAKNNYNPGDNNPQNAIEEFQKNLDKLYQELDILSTKKVLSEKFLRTRDKWHIKIDRLFVPTATSYFSYFSLTSILTIYQDVIPYSSTFTSLLPIIIPVVGGAIAGDVYWRIRSHNQTKVFNKFNEQLDKSKLDDLVNAVYREKIEIDREIYTKVAEIGREILKFKEQIYLLEATLPKESQELTYKDELRKILLEPYPELIITEELIENILSHPELYTTSPISTKTGNIYTSKDFAKRSDKVLGMELPKEELNNILIRSKKQLKIKRQR